MVDDHFWRIHLAPKFTRNSPYETAETHSVVYAIYAIYRRINPRFDGQKKVSVCFFCIQYHTIFLWTHFVDFFILFCMLIVHITLCHYQSTISRRLVYQFVLRLGIPKSTAESSVSIIFPWFIFSFHHFRWIFGFSMIFHWFSIILHLFSLSFYHFPQVLRVLRHVPRIFRDFPPF